jgi:hypothetical protein
MGTGTSEAAPGLAKPFRPFIVSALAPAERRRKLRLESSLFIVISPQEVGIIFIRRMGDYSAIIVAQGVLGFRILTFVLCLSDCLRG